VRGQRRTNPKERQSYGKQECQRYQEQPVPLACQSEDHGLELCRDNRADASSKSVQQNFAGVSNPSHPDTEIHAGGFSSDWATTCRFITLGKQARVQNNAAENSVAWDC
jgi:hypothetical protein